MAHSLTTEFATFAGLCQEFRCVADSPDVQASPFLSLLRQYMQREPAGLDGYFVSSQDRCQLEEDSATSFTQLTQAVLEKQGMAQEQAYPQSRQICGLTQDLTSSIASAAQVRLR